MLGKRSLTSDIISAMSPSPSRAPSYGSPIIREKKSRLATYDGQERALEMLMSPITSGSFDANDFLETVGLKNEWLTEDEGTLAGHIQKLKDTVDRCDRSRSTKKELVSLAVGVVSAMATSFQKLQGLENQPVQKPVKSETQMISEVKDSSQLEAVDSNSEVCRDNIRLLMEVAKCEQEMENILVKCEEQIRKGITDAEKMTVVGRADLSAKEQQIRQHETKLAEADAEISSAIAQDRSESITSTNVVTVCLDAVLYPTPEMAALIQNRKLCSMAKSRAEGAIETSRRGLKLNEQVLCVLRRAATLLATQARAVVAKAEAHRDVVVRVCRRTLLSTIPEVASSLSNFLKFQIERNEHAAKSADAKREELSEHLRLYGDEAPFQLKELKERLAEFEGIRGRTEEVLSKVAAKQRHLWTAALCRTRDVDAAYKALFDMDASTSTFAQPLESEQNQACILPTDVVVRLQRCMEEVRMELPTSQSPLRTSLEEILRACSLFSSVPPRSIQNKDSSSTSSDENGNENARIENIMSKTEMSLDNRITEKDVQSFAANSHELIVSNSRPQRFEEHYAEDAENNGNRCIIS
mmetsp:Transcript_3258/g.5458  ORF Transcript_3258/g.5458 Transcript_3258/m.5458 type:complete len:583 (+) Transcript_3258:217-1965(+)